MAITRLGHHDHHQVRIHLTKPNCIHYAALRCVKCNTHIQWLNHTDAQSLRQLGVEQQANYKTQGLSL
jgi:hypothetical protein